MPSLKIDIIVDDKGRPVINNVTNSMKELAGATKQADAALKAHTGATNSHESSMAGLTRSVLRLYAAYYVVSTGIQGFASLLMQGVNAIDTYNLSIAKMAAMMTGMMVAEPGKNLAQQYQEARAYAEQLNVMIEQVDKNTLLTASDLRSITEEMMKQGVVVDTNSRKQVEAFTSLANALAVISVGYPNKEIQLRQEVRALLQGELRDTNQLAKMLDAQLNGELKEQLALWETSEEKIIGIGDLLRGFAAAQGDINASWEAAKTTLETIYEQVLRAGFQTAFKDINRSVKELSEWAVKHKDEIGALVNDGYVAIRDVIKDVVGIAAPWKEELKGVLLIVKEISEGTATAIKMMKLGSEGAKEGLQRGYTGPNSMFYVGNYVLDKLMLEEQQRHYDQVLKMAIPGKANADTVAKPNLKNTTDTGKGGKGKSGADSYASTLRQITDETKAWQDKIEELNPALEKEDSAILKLQNDADTLIKKLQDQGAKGKVDVSGQIAKVKEGLSQGISYISEKEMAKLYEDYQKMVSDEVEYGLNENERAANQIIHKEEEKLLKLAELWAKDAITDQEYYDLEAKIIDNANAAMLDKETEYNSKIANIRYDNIKDIQGYEEEAYEIRLDQIDKEAAKRRKDGADEVSTALWVKNQKMIAWAELARSSNSVTAGMKAAWYDLSQKQLTWGQAAYNVTIDLYEQMGDAWGDSIYDVITGDLDSLSDLWEDTWKSMLKTMTRYLGKMVFEAAAKDIVLLFKSEWTEGGSSVLGIVDSVLGFAGSLFGGSANSFDTSSDWTDGLGFAGGGWVPGYASGGNSPANDTVRAMLSPGEFVVDRETIAGMGRGGDTMLAHINAREAALLKALGGAGSINPRTGLPEFYSYGMSSTTGNMWFQADDGTMYYYDPEKTSGYGDGDYLYSIADNGARTYASQDGNTSLYSDFQKASKAQSASIHFQSGLSKITYDVARNWFAGTYASNPAAVAAYLDSGGMWQGYNADGNYQVILATNMEPETDKWSYTWGKGATSPSIGYYEGAETSGMEYAPYFIALGTLLTGGMLAPLALSSIAAGAAVGAGLGASSSALNQQVATGQVNIGQVGVAALTGGATGALASWLSGASLTGGGTTATAAHEAAQAEGVGAMIAEAMEQYPSTWAGSIYESNWGALLDTGLGAAKNAILKMGVKYAINSLLGGGSEGDAGGYMKITYMGADDGGLLASLAGQMQGLNGEFAFSASDGLDYVPYDNFLIKAHKGEAVLTAKENEKRGNEKIVIHNHLYVDGKEIKAVVEKVVINRNSRGLTTERVYS